MDLFQRADGSIYLVESPDVHAWMDSHPDLQAGETMIAGHSNWPDIGSMWDWEDWEDTPSVAPPNRLLILAALGLADD